MKHNFRELVVWQKSMELVTGVYNFCLELPADEKYGIISQIKRSSISIPSNIAEGSGRNTPKEFSRFLSIALGSSYELETQLLLASKLNNINEKSFINIIKQIIEIQKILSTLINKFETKAVSIFFCLFSFILN